MIIWIILILSIITFISLLIIKKPVQRNILSGISIILLIISIFLLIANLSSHYGMEKITISKTKQIYTASPQNTQIKMIAVKKIGASNIIAIYRENPNEAEATAHFTPSNKILESIKHTSKLYIVNENLSATVTTKTTKWEYKSKLYKALFYTQETDNVVKIENYINIPSNWKIIYK